MMKSLIFAVALASIASPSFALPANPQPASAPSALTTQSENSAAVTNVQYRRHHRYYRYGHRLRARDPDPAVRTYLRNDPPGRHWGD